VWWLRVSASVTLKDLFLADTEASIFPNATEMRNYHYILVLWLKYWIYQIKWDPNMKNDTKQEYINEKQKMISELKWRGMWPKVVQEPFYSHLMS
jgi:hypothetical protein